MARAPGDLQIISGNANLELTRSIARHLACPLASTDIFQFSNENIFVRINETVRENDVFVVQPFSSPVNTSIMELLIVVDALKRASAGRITAVIPYFAYGRTDKKDQPRVPITARLLANLIERAGANRILTIDLHAGQIEGFFDVPVDHLTAFPLLSRYFADLQIEDAVVVAPDLGTAKKARNFAESIGAPLALLEKRRPTSGGGSEMLNVIGDVKHRRAILVDDEIDTAGSMLAAARILEAEGVKEIYACATHGVLSGPAIERIEDGPFTQIVVTDTIPARESAKIKVIPIGELLSEAIQRIHSGGSVGAMFKA